MKQSRVMFERTIRTMMIDRVMSSMRDVMVRMVVSVAAGAVGVRLLLSPLRVLLILHSSILKPDFNLPLG